MSRDTHVGCCGRRAPPNRSPKNDIVIEKLPQGKLGAEEDEFDSAKLPLVGGLLRQEPTQDT